MADLSVNGFVNKRDAAQNYNRSHRSLSRDITTAVKLRDADVLRHFRLQTQDGQVREGTDVTIEILDTLRDARLVPTWWADPEYLRAKYGRRGEARLDEEVVDDSVSTDEPSDVKSQSPDTATSAPNDTGIEELLKQQIADLKTDKEHLLKELERSYELRKEDNELREQNNKLMNQLYGLLQSMQQPGSANVLPPSEATRQAAVIDAAPQATDPVTSDSTAQGTKSARAKKSKPAARKKTSTGRNRQPTAVEKHLPTLSRLFSRLK